MRERRAIVFGPCFFKPGRMAPCDRMLAGGFRSVVVGWSVSSPGFREAQKSQVLGVTIFFLAKGDNGQSRRCR